MPPEETNPSPDAPAPPPRQKPFKWGFFSAAGVILFLMIVGDVIGRLVHDFPARLEAGNAPVAKDWLVLAFFICTVGWIWASRTAVRRFFRTMHVGVTVVSMLTLSVLVGVLVPQIDGFEDPKQRVNAANYEEQFAAFKWAEGYFLYHMLHLYGIGMPEADIPPPVIASLDKFGNLYGIEERDNRLKRMRAAFSGQEKTQEIREFIYANENELETAFDICTTLQLNRAYKSGWFATLVSLLGVAVFFNTFTGKPKNWVSLRRCGFFVTHIGIMTMLVGGGVSKLTTKRGILHLDLRDSPQDTYLLHYDRNQPTKLPFHVGLERFARKEWMQLEVEFPEESFQTRPPTWTLWEGKEIDLDYTDGTEGEVRPRLSLRVKSLHDRADVDLSLEEAGDDVGGATFPAVTFQVSEAERAPQAEGDAPRRQYEVNRIPGIDPYYLTDRWWQFRLQPVFSSLTPEQVATHFPEDDDTVGLLFTRSTRGAAAQESPHRFRVGETIETPEGFKIQVTRGIPAYRVSNATGQEVFDPRPMGEQNPDNPAVEILITPPDGGAQERRIVRELVDAESAGLQSKYEYSELLTYLMWDKWRSPGPPRYFLHWGEGQEPVLIDEAGTITPVAPGTELPLVGPGGEPADTKVVATAIHDRATLRKEVSFLPEREKTSGGVDLDFYGRDTRGLVLDVVTDPGTAEEKVETVRMATDGELAAHWRSADGRVRVRFFENTALMPFEWRSVLSIWDRDENGQWQKVDAGTERQREIRVNDYFKWKGYRFFQTNASADLPNYSGIGVVYDPGIPLVLLGMYTIIAGTVIAFLVRPIVEARRKVRKAA